MGIQIMNKYLIAIIATVAIIGGTDALARDSVQEYDLVDVLDKDENKSRLTGVSFYFGDQEHPPVAQELGEDRTNKKTNAFNKSDEVACQWVMMSALLQLHQRAKILGADAVVNIRSNYKNNVVSSNSKYTCGAGGIVAGVALIGDFVKLE
jgi:hypothetical protein